MSIINGQHVIEWLENNDGARLELSTQFAEHILEQYEDLEWDDCLLNILCVMKDKPEFAANEIKKLTAVTFMLSKQNANKLGKLNAGQIYEVQCGIDKIIGDMK